MSEAYVVAVEGLAGVGPIEQLPANIRLAALRAINKTADYGRAEGARRIRDQVNFAARYLTGLDGSGQARLAVTERATNASLSATISGRDRPTSLARFVTGSRTPSAIRRQGGIKVSVKAGGAAKTIGRSFLFKLRSGNLGLAVRTGGGPPRNAYKPKLIGKNLYLLYGPSVDQVFGGPRGVAEGEVSEIADRLEAEFNRLLNLDI